VAQQQQRARREARERVRRVKEVGDALVLLHTGTDGEKQGGGGSNGGGGAVHGRHAPATCPAVEAFPRARGVQRSGRRGRRFQAFSGRIRRWAKNEVCSTLDTLQL
jgi:hypothetical protein